MFIHLAQNEMTDFPFDELITLAETISEGDSLQTIPQLASLRVFDVIGNDGLNSLHAEEIAATRARLVQPWNFPLPRNPEHRAVLAIGDME